MQHLNFINDYKKTILKHFGIYLPYPIHQFYQIFIFYGSLCHLNKEKNQTEYHQHITTSACSTRAIAEHFQPSLSILIQQFSINMFHPFVSVLNMC